MEWSSIDLPSVARSVDRQISKDMERIRHLFCSHRLIDLFSEMVNAEADKGKYTILNFSKKGGKVNARTLVSEVAAALEELGPVELLDPSTHGRRQHQVQILQGALEKLKGDARDLDKETAAINQDDARFRARSKHISTAQNLQLNPVVVYDMKEPARSFTLPMFSKCREVKRYLQFKKHATLPDLWIRYQDRQKQPLTPNGFYWEYLRLDESVQGKYIELVDREDCGAYIVVLKCVRSPVLKEVPRPIDLPRSDTPCCSAACPYLWMHLSSILSPERLLQARTIDGLDVLNEKFDTNLFDSLTNHLIVDVEGS